MAPPIIRGTLASKGDTSEILRIPLGRVFPLYRVAFRHPKRRQGRVIFQTKYDGGDWDSGWGGAVTSQECFLRKEDGRECDFRIFCTAAPAPIDYAITYLRQEHIPGTALWAKQKVGTEEPDFMQMLELMILQQNLPLPKDWWKG